MSAQRSRKFRFSMLNVLLVLTVAAATGGMYAAWQRAEQTADQAAAQMARQEAEFAEIRAENRRLREEAGALTIDDPQQAYAIRLQSQADKTWSYRIYLPPGRAYVVAAQVNNLSPADEPPRFLDSSLPDTRTIAAGENNAMATGLAPGEYLVSLAIVEQRTGVWDVRFHIRSSGVATPPTDSQTGYSLPPDENQWPQHNPAFSTGGVQGSQAKHDPQRVFVLLDGRVFGRESGNSSAASPQGAMIWIEPNPATEAESGDHPVASSVVR